ncbi:MAG: phosphoribosyltransferase [Lachnospiraceae bacterium]|nr:phosphoribosyltransferase [Lachnospiraceae bacterium]
MERLLKRQVKIPAKVNHKIELKVIPGHFATNHSHVNYYLDITPIKCRHNEAQLAAKEFVKQYKNNHIVDTIVCMDGCEVIGAYLAEELTTMGIMSINTHECVNVITPEINAGGLIFRENVEAMLKNKHVVLLLASATTGKTIEQSMQAIQYYGGMVEGVSAIFAAVDKVDDIEIDSIYHVSDINDYQSYELNKCPYCQAKHKLDAIVNSYGFSVI